MAEKRTRRRFTAEFKAEAVKRLLEGGKGLGEVATELGLSPGQLSGWRNEHLAAGSAEALAARKAEQAELQRLQARGTSGSRRRSRSSRRPRLFSPGGSREPVRLRRRRAGEPRRRHAVPGRRRERRAASTPGCARSRPPHPGRGGGRAARPDRPHLRRPPARLRLAAGPRRAAPGGAAPLAPAGRAADARDGPRSPAGPPPAAADHRQPPRPAGRAEPARPPLRRRPARHGLAGRHQLPADRRGLAVPGRDRGPGHARDRRLEHGRPPPGRAVRATRW